MTEPMKTAKRLLYEKAELNFIGEQLIIQLMEDYAAQQVAAERERIKEKVRELMFTMPTGRVPREGLNIAFYKVLELIDSL